MFSQAIRGLKKFCCQQENNSYLIWFKDIKQQKIFNTAVRKLICSFFCTFRIFSDWLAQFNSSSSRQLTTDGNIFMSCYCCRKKGCIWITYLLSSINEGLNWPASQSFLTHTTNIITLIRDKACAITPHLVTVRRACTKRFCGLTSCGCMRSISNNSEIAYNGPKSSPIPDN